MATLKHCHCTTTTTTTTTTTNNNIIIIIEHCLSAHIKTKLWEEDLVKV
jgi:hypothetical protein